MRALAAFSLCSAMGQCFIYYTITEFSPLILATVTTTRKIFSTLVSVFRDPSAPPPRHSLFLRLPSAPPPLAVSSLAPQPPPEQGGGGEGDK